MIAIAASVAAHAIAIVALAGSYGTLAADSDSAITVEDELKQIRLGIERSEAQTIDWVGYEEYQRHLAPPAEQNQAQMILGASQASAPSPPTPEQTTPVATSAEAPKPAPKPAPTIEELLLDQLFENFDNPTLFALRQPVQEETPKMDKAKDEPDRKTDKPKKQSKPKPATEPSKESKTVDENAGDSDKDADAVSAETDEAVTEYQLGRPLAAQGLDIRTVRPVWSARTLVTARPRNPKVRIHFNRKGRVSLATIEESTGEPDVDRPLLDAIYKWRAVGEGLEELPKGEPEATIAVVLKIHLR